MAVVKLRMLDDILARYGNQLASLGQKQAVKVMARALNYEGRKVYTLIKRGIARQSSIPYGMVNAATKFRSAATVSSSNLTASIVASAGYPTLKPFKARQTAAGSSATVRQKRITYRSSFGAPGDRPKVTARLGGIPHMRVGKSRLPIKTLYGPNVADELMRDAPPKLFEAAKAAIIARVEKEIKAILRGY